MELIRETFAKAFATLSMLFIIIFAGPISKFIDWVYDTATGGKK